VGVLFVNRGGGAGIGGEDDGEASGCVAPEADSIPAARSRRYTRVVSARTRSSSLWSSLLSLFNVTPNNSGALLGDYTVLYLSFQ
jgi:hypothetical protein